MITDDERHDIADGLRRLAVCRHNTGVPDSEILDILEISCADIPNCSDAYDVEMLAELIDLPTCKNVADLDRESFKCSRCGYRVLSIDGAPDAAKLVAPEGGVVDFGCCPNCRAEVVEDD